MKPKTVIVLFVLLGLALVVWAQKKISDYPNTATAANTDLMIWARPGVTNYNQSYLQLAAQLKTNCYWSLTGSNIYFDTGNVGIGTTAPLAVFDINGSVSGFAFRVNTNQLVVTNGTVGIGKIPAAGYALDIIGDGRINHAWYLGSGYNLGWGTTEYIAGINASSELRFGTASAWKMYLVTNNLGIGIGSPSDMLDVNSNQIRLRTSKTPANATDTGLPGQWCWDSTNIYVCIATNTWRRAALSTWP